ncbi:MAG: tetratricopeptide repeat protein [Bacteroidales bacterium]
MKLNLFITVFNLILAFPLLTIAGAEDIDQENEPSVSDIQILKEGQSDHAAIFREANELYAEGNYDRAVDLYKTILASGYHSASLYYNLGNAYYRSGNIPPSILNYERALLLAPGDEDIRFNLDLARAQIKDRIEEVPDFFINRMWKGVRDIINYRSWAAISAGTFILTLMSLSGFLLISKVVMKKLFFWVAVSLLFISVFSFSAGLDQRNYVKNHNSAIIFSPVISVKSSPDINSADLFVLHEGTKVSVEDSIGDWREVRLSDGNKGWLHKDGLEMI